ncbi:MAG: OmpH family outer membrane protein, partial [Aquiluna sp.]
PKLLAEGAEAVGARALLESGEKVAARTAAQEAGQAPLGQFLPVTSRQLVAREAGEEAAEEVAEAGARIGLRDIAERTLPGMVTRGVEGVTNKILAKAAGDSVLESAIRTVAPYTVPAALESGIYGFTQGMAEQYLNDPYSSDAVLASAGLEAGSNAFLFGGGVGLGLTGAITTAKLTPAAITKTAKAIYKPLADNFGDKFASGLGKFVASEDPRVQKAFTEQLTGILQFNDEAQGFAAKMQRLQDQIADMRDRGVEQAVIAKTYDDEIKALRLDKAELDAKSKQAAKSLKGLQETLSEQRKGIEKELGLQQQELLAGVAEDLQEALASQRSLAAFFGDTTTKSGTKSVSKVDAAIRENLKDASLDYNAIFQNVKGPNGSLRAAVNELESAATEAAARGSAEI